MGDLNTVRREAAGLLAELRQEGAAITCPCCPKTRVIEEYRPFVAGENPLWLPEVLAESGSARKKVTDNLSKRAGRAQTASETTKKMNIGRIAENLPGLLTKLKGDSRDYRTLEGAIDVVGLHGAAKGKLELLEVADIKSAEAKLSKHQQAIMRAVHEGRVVLREISEKNLGIE
jgi:predicted Holliday junction resolvase-like endonuclease